MAFDYTSGNPDNLTAGTPARMVDIQGPFYDIRTYLNSIPVTPAGATPVVTNTPLLDVGVQGQIRAGRQLIAADFTDLGLAQPLGLWNLSGLTNLGSDGRALTNKGAVPFGVGITGLSTTCAVFAGSTGQALYIADSGAADKYRITTGSWGCWFRTAKRGTAQTFVGKWSSAVSGLFLLYANASNTLQSAITTDGNTAGGNVFNAVGLSDVCDDRWHHAVGTVDGTTQRLYIDGVCEAVVNAGPIYTATAPALNVGANSADGATAGGAPCYGRVDEAFVTADVLSDDQIRCLYATKLTHALAVAPTGVRLNVHRKRKGAPLVVADFTTQPLRLHNFTAGALTDQGSGGQALTNNGAAVGVAGADGAPGGAYSFAGAQYLSATDAGLPAGTAARSFGLWFKTTYTAGNAMLIAWGTLGSNCGIYVNSGGLTSVSGADSLNGPFVADGQWHHVVEVNDNAAGDGVRRKLYLDGRLIGDSTVLGTITLGGAGKFRIGAQLDGTALMIGQIDGAFVTGYAMDATEVFRLYAKGSQDLGASPKNAGDHVERVDSASVLFVGDTLESQNTVDLGVLA